MARTDTRLRAAHNQMLDLLADVPPGGALPPETQLSDSLRVSRTVVRAALRRMEVAGIIAIAGRVKTLIRAPLPSDRLPERDDYITLRELEGRFLDWVLRFDVPADTPLNVAQLAKQFSVPPHMLQEFLASLGQFGLVERRPRGGWRLLGFTADYAVELSEFRSLLEVNAIEAVLTCPENDPIWGRLDQLKHQHESLMQRIDTDFHDFSRLDEEFHASLNAVVHNRFVSDFQKVISLIFHYHYQWDKQLERHRNAAAIGEHLAIIAALRSRDKRAAVAATRAHLATSKETLLGSLRVNRLV
jgi:DNA-binding GntR family transcriptional regulator